MMSFDQLSYTEQKRRWLHIAHTLMKAYGLKDAELSLISFSNNAVLAVNWGAQVYILRLHRPNLLRAEWIQSEVMWLKALSEQTDIVAPRPVEIGGKYVFSIEDNASETPIYGVMFQHLEGERRDPAQITVEDSYRIGILLGKLHLFSKQFQPPQGFSRPKLDWEGLLGENSLYNPGDGERIFTEEQRHIFQLVGAAVRSAMDELGQSKDVFGLIHADLLLKNILFYEGEARPLDFEYSGWGYFLYDLTPFLWQLRHDKRYSDLRDALWHGYTHLNPLSQRERSLLDTFIVGRHLASCRWIAGNLGNADIRDNALNIIATRTEEMRRYLQSGSFPSP